MKFAAFATLVTALAVAPFAAKAFQPTMTEAEFMQAAACYAYETLPQSGDAMNASSLRAQLAFAQHEQTSETVVAARHHIRAIRENAMGSDAAGIENARNHVCSGVESLVAEHGADPRAA